MRPHACVRRRQIRAVEHGEVHLRHHMILAPSPLSSAAPVPDVRIHHTGGRNDRLIWKRHGFEHRSGFGEWQRRQNLIPI